jgi:hypothetical protein
MISNPSSIVGRKVESRGQQIIRAIFIFLTPPSTLNNDKECNRNRYNSSLLPSSFNICYTLPGLDRLSGLAAGSKMNYHTIVKMLKKVNIVKWGVSEFSTGLKSRQQKTLTVAGTIGNFTFYDNFKI